MDQISKSLLSLKHSLSPTLLSPTSSSTSNLTGQLQSIQASLIRFALPTSPVWIDAWQCGAIIAVLSDGLVQFDCFFAQLCPFYFPSLSRGNSNTLLDTEENACRVIGLALLRYVLEGKSSAYHMLLARLSVTSRLLGIPHLGNPYINFATTVERCLQDGALHSNVLLDKAVPSAEYGRIYEMIKVARVQSVAADAIEKAVVECEIDRAMQIVLLDGGQADRFRQMAMERGWAIDSKGRSVHFGRTQANKSFDRNVLMARSIGYARQLSNIID